MLLHRLFLMFALFSLGLFSACAQPNKDRNAGTSATNTTPRPDRITKSESEWRKLLTAEQYNILREEGTERAFTGKLWNNKEAGTYLCAACQLPLFQSDTKFESGTGWPSFWKPIAKDAVAEVADNDHGMVRTEVECARCGGHLGHVFDDGPKPTGKRYCMNSGAMTFQKK